MARLLSEQRQWGEAEQHYLKAASLLEASDDLQGAAKLESELAAMRQQSGGYLVATDNTAVEPAEIDPPSSSDDPEFEIMIHDHVSTEFVFEPNLLIDGWQEDRISPYPRSQERLAAVLHPAMTPRARVYSDVSGAIWISLPQDELRTRPQQGCTFMKRQRREVRVSGNRLLVWDLIRNMDGSSTVGELLSRLRADKRERAGNLLAALASCGAVDVSGRAIGRFLHTATKKGVLSAGGLVGDELRKLATDGDYRKHPHAPKLALSPAIPETLQHFRALTRARRSRRDYESAGVKRQDLEAVLDTACGVTGSVYCDDREVKLRAYPSSGALYAVEISLLVLRVDGFEPGLYHYRAVDNLLEVVKPNLDRKAILGAMLPMERQMVGGAAAMICLTGNFPRHERKYGEGGYRMLVAEAGHISQNVVLAATALGLAARPFGGVFDSTFNAELGLEQDKEEFLLAVLIGRGGKSK
jgi:SagB-type dehydrogenase family enzyme